MWRQRSYGRCLFSFGGDMAQSTAHNQPTPPNQDLYLDWLDNLEAERNELIMRLRRIERVLIKYRRLKAQDSRPKRMR